ncbi:MAG: hypothetical protein ACREPL_00560 [Rhodanobacteraceae bacterium]
MQRSDAGERYVHVAFNPTYYLLELMLGIAIVGVFVYFFGALSVTAAVVIGVFQAMLGDALLSRLQCTSAVGRGAMDVFRTWRTRGRAWEWRQSA